MRAFLGVLAVAAIFHLDPCGGGGGGGGGAANPPAGNGGVKNGAALCAIFHDGWTYDTATGYDPPKAPIIASLNGTADFNADSTYLLDYTIGGLINHFEGTYTQNGSDLHLADKNGDRGSTFDFSATCGDDTKELVLTIKNPDGSPQVVYGLHSRKK